MLILEENRRNRAFTSYLLQYMYKITPYLLQNMS